MLKEFLFPPQTDNKSFQAIPCASGASCDHSVAVCGGWARTLALKVGRNPLASNDTDRQAIPL